MNQQTFWPDVDMTCSSENQKCFYKIMAIHPEVFEIFQSEPKLWSDRWQTGVAIYRVVLLMRPKIPNIMRWNVTPVWAFHSSVERSPKNVWGSSVFIIAVIQNSLDMLLGLAWTGVFQWSHENRTLLRFLVCFPWILSNFLDEDYEKILLFHCGHVQS